MITSAPWCRSSLRCRAWNRLGNMTRVERWRPVVGYEGSYEVSDHGRVRSLDRAIEHAGPQGRRFTTTRRGQLLANCKHSAGYQQVWVRNAEIPGQKRRKAFVHVLVARAFLGDPPCPGMKVCHYDGDPANNNVSNLRWDNVSGNRRDAVRHRTHSESRKSQCPYGHSLVEPNLLQARLPHRICRSCCVGKGRADRTGVDRRTAADAFYLSLGFSPARQSA
ncbi:NUMOD4 domain-containing protein [Mycolicibacterium fortuitum]|uniref:NUMOD4 domain-containing protein n=1 Tax=Mycolicibacterium fortuitum TaxID=1766 RepID=UPI003AAB5250